MEPGLGDLGVVKYCLKRVFYLVHTKVPGWSDFHLHGESRRHGGIKAGFGRFHSRLIRSHSVLYLHLKRALETHSRSSAGFCRLGRLDAGLCRRVLLDASLGCVSW